MPGSTSWWDRPIKTCETLGLSFPYISFKTAISMVWAEVLSRWKVVTLSYFKGLPHWMVGLLAVLDEPRCGIASPLSEGHRGGHLLSALENSEAPE